MQIITLVFAALAASSIALAETYDYSYGASDVSVIQINDIRTLAYYTRSGTYYNVYINTLFAVKNKSSSKIVGMQYTNTSWSTFSEAQASYVRPLDTTYELWNLTIFRGTFNSQMFPKREYELAAFVSYSGAERVWDPRNNYYVYLKATPAAPITSSSDLAVLTISTSVFNGVARTWTISPNDKVTVRYTIDNWASYVDFDATRAGFNNIWKWTIQGVSTGVSFAVRYDRADGTTFWANNNGENYHVSSPVF